MPRRCPVCMHPDGDRITGMVLRGEISVREAAERLGVTEDQMSWHLRHHVVEVPEPREVKDDPRDLLIELRDHLWDLVYGDLATGRVNPQLIRELRTLVKDLMELRVSRSSCSDVLAEWLRNFASWAVENLPPDVSDRIASYIETHPVS